MVYLRVWLLGLPMSMVTWLTFEYGSLVYPSSMAN
jgi:hypothetical protein